MKKIWKMGLCGLVVVMMAAGCSKKTENTENVTTAESTESSQEGESQNAGDQVTLGEYKGIEVTLLSTEITDEEVEEELQALLEAYPIVTEVDRAAQEGDTVNIDYAGMKDGVPFQGGTAEGYDLVLGSKTFIDGFEDGLIGSKKGQELSLNLTFPENYGNAELAGEEVVFDVTVNAVKESKTGVLNDEFVAENTEFATVEECRKGIREELEKMAEDNAINQKKNDVFMAVMDNAEVSVSEDSVQTVYDNQKSYYEGQASSFGIDLETLAGFYGMDMEAFEKQLKSSSMEVAKQNAVIFAIAEAENIVVEEADKKELAEEFGFGSWEEMSEAVGEEAMNNYILPDKVLTFLADNAVEK